MQRHSQNRCDRAPFEATTTVRITKQIEEGMHNLHNDDILRRDLKAENLLTWTTKKDTNPSEMDTLLSAIADFESSVGVILIDSRKHQRFSSL